MGRPENFKCSTGYCLPLNISFTEQGKKASEWQRGYTWGLRWYLASTDRGVTFKIRLKVKTTVTQAIGPNRVFSDQKPPSQSAQALPPAVTHNSCLTPSTYTSTSKTPITALPSYRPGTGDRLLNLIQRAYSALNFADPNKTQDCWLCLVLGPPYYEGVAVLGNYSNQTSAPSSCTSNPRHKLTLSEVSGKGICIGTVPPSHQALCNQTQAVSTGSYFLAAPIGAYWACSTGLTPCVSAAMLNIISDYCVLIELWPKFTYHDPKYVYSHFKKMFSI